MKVDFYRHSLDENDKTAVRETLDSLFLTTGPRVAAFEEKFAAYSGRRRATAVASCTAALHLSLLALGIGDGDEVIVPAMTFFATATPVFYAGAKPVLVDVCPDSGLIDVEKTESAITERTRAIIPVHLYGAMADMRSLSRIAKKHGLKIIEDAAHCVEGERDGVRPGDLGDAVCYSFYATKNLACGEGGAVATDDEELAGRVKLLRQHGMSKSAAERYTGKYQHWDMLTLGWKHNLSDIHAALLLGQLDRLGDLLKKREAAAKVYDQAFSGAKGVRVPSFTGRSARHLYTIWVDEAKRDAILSGLQEAGIGVAVNYRAIHTLSWLKEKLSLRDEDYPEALRIGNSTISLPFFPNIREDEQEHVIKHVLALSEK